MTSRAGWYNAPLAMLAGFFIARWDMFRELGYGAMFFLCAMIGACGGFACLTPAIRGGTHESMMWEDVGHIVLGAIAGSAIWLWYRYNFLSRPNDGQNLITH